MASVEELSPASETGETLGTTTTQGVPLYTSAGPSRPVNASTMLFVGTEDAVRGRLPQKSAAGYKMQILTVPRVDGFRKFYDQGEHTHLVLFLHRNTTRIAEFDDPLGFFFHRVKLGRVSLVFVGENDQENFAALCELDPNIAAINEAGRVFFWNELEGSPKQKIDDLTLRIQDSLGLVPAGTQRVVHPKRRPSVVGKDFWKFNNLQALLTALGVAALFISLLCYFPPIDRQARTITAPGAEKWTPAERETYLAELRKLELERQAVGAERQRIDTVRRKMIEKINDIEELENTINREKRTIVCGLLERREELVREYTSPEYAQRHIDALKREVARLEATGRGLPSEREELEVERSISEKNYDLRVWAEGLAELKKVDEELARSDVFSWSEAPEFCGIPGTLVH